MTLPDASPEPTARPPTSSAAALPFDAKEGLAPVAVSGTLHASGVIHDSLPRVIRRVALPAVASNLLMTVFATVDAYWVGQHIGPRGLAAVSTSLFWIWLIISIAEMVSVGLTAVAARRHGQRRHADAAFAVGDSLIFALIIGVLVALAGLLFLDDLFAAMRTPAEVTELGTAYLGTYLLGAPLIYGYFAVDAGFRASGDTRTPFVLLATSVTATLVLDPLLILGAWGAPRLGIAGAAVSLLATRGTVFALGILLLARRGLLRFHRPDVRVMSTVARIGMPTAVTGVAFSLIYVAMTPTTTRFGTPALAALGLGHRIESWLYMVGVGFGAAAAAIVGQNLGAGQPERAERAGWITVGYATIPAIAASIAALAIPERLASIFTTDAAVIEVTASYLRIAALSQLVICSEIVLEGALGGAGDTIPPMLTSTALTALRVPLAAWAAARWGTDGIWWTISLTAIARGLAMMALWRAGHWKRKSV